MYAHSGHVARVPGVSGNQAGRSVSGRNRGIGRTHRSHRAASLTSGPGSGVRPRCGESGAGASEHRGLCVAHSLSSTFVLAGGRGAGGRGGHTTGRAAGGPGSFAIPVDGGREGFSLMADGPLDMRMDRSQGQTAADIVNFESEKQLADLIFQLGEERRSRKNSQSNRAGTADQDDRSVGQADRRGRAPHGKNSSRDADLHGAAHRGESGDTKNWTRCSNRIPRLVKPGGRAVMLTFMSLEDRKVKQSFQALAKDGRAKFSPGTSCGLRKKKSGTTRRREAPSYARVELLVMRTEAALAAGTPPPVPGAEVDCKRREQDMATLATVCSRIFTKERGTRPRRVASSAERAGARLRQRRYLFLRQADRQQPRGAAGRSAGARGVLEDDRLGGGGRACC